MDHSTFDRAAIRASADRAVGHVRPYPTPPLAVPMTAAGGLYASAADLARFLRFELNGGTIDGRVVLDSKWLHEMEIGPGTARRRAGGLRARCCPPPLEPLGATTGPARARRWRVRVPSPTCGGFPSSESAVAILTNSQDHQLQNDVSRCRSWRTCLSEPGVYQDRLLALPWRPPVAGREHLLRAPGRAADPRRDMLRWPRREMRPPAGQPPSASTESAAWGYLDLSGRPDRFLVDAGVPYFETDDNADVTRIVTASSKSSPTCFSPTTVRRWTSATRVLRAWRNLRLVRVSGGLRPGSGGSSGQPRVIAVIWLVAAPVPERADAPARVRSSPQGSAHRDAPHAPGYGAGG